MPNELGQPCWETSHIPKAITRTAKIDVAQKDYFIACHTPIDGISNDNTNEKYSEQGFFDELFKDSHGNVLSIVHGDPGAGKSHLIQWLKLRCEDKIERGELNNYVAVLVQRRYGNLKDALEQIVEQLGGDFERYIESVRTAVGNISETTSRSKFALEFFYELSPAHRGKSVRGDLKRLPEAFRSPGFADWICREGGPIDRNVKRLTEKSEVDERESIMFPEFNERDFEYQPRPGDQNIEGLVNLFDDFNDEPELRHQAAEICNAVLPNVIRERTGLTDNGLMKVFDKIRVDLNKQGKSLALFIEDISVMSALDEEIFAAVEPRAQSDLCKMIAVLGVTDQGRQKLMRKLEDNRRQRITHPVSVGGQANDEWSQNTLAVTEFSARYLNAIRLAPTDVTVLAENRRNGTESMVNACDECAVKDECHPTFGSVTIDGSEVGLFPFSNSTPQYLLSNLATDATVRSNPRGLLTQILEPVLSTGHDQLTQGRFPHLTLAIDLPPVTYWRGFEQAYCGGWSSESKRRIKFLVEAWVDAKNEKEAARKLKPLLAPLHLGIFTRELEPALPEPETSETIRTTFVDAPSYRENPELKTYLSNIQKWAAGGRLKGDSEVRDLLKELFNTSIPWEDEVAPPLGVRKNLVHSRGNTPFDIDGMIQRPANVNLKFNFRNDSDSASLFEALGQFNILGRKSWTFHNAEVYKRDVFRWVRTHARSYMRQVEPQPPLDASVPVRTAVQLLALFATVRRNSKLPIEPRESDALVEEILRPVGTNGRHAISPTWKQLLEDMAQRGSKLRDFVISEIMVPQGRTGSGNFIDPAPIINFARDFAEGLHIDQLDDAYFVGHLKSRYESLRGVNEYVNLTSVLETERAAIDKVVNEILFEIRVLGIETDDLPRAVTDFCKMSVALSTAVQASNLYVAGVADFQQLLRANAYTSRCDVWVTALRSASEIANSDSVEKVLIFSPNNLLELKEAVLATTSYVGRVTLEAGKIIDHIVSDGDPDDYLKVVKNSLEQITTLDLVG